MTHPETKRAAIIGGGMAGCAAARELARIGRRVTLFEASDDVGGRARSWHRDELVPDYGINLWLTNRWRELVKLVREFRLEDEIVPMTAGVIGVQNGRAAPISGDSPLSVLRYPFLGLKDKVKLGFVTGLLTATRGRYNLFDPAVLAKFDNGTIEQWARSRLSDQIYHSVVRPMVEPFLLADPGRVSAAHFRTLLSYAFGAKFFVLRSGAEIIAQNLVRDVDVRLRTEVTGIEWQASEFRLSAASDGSTLVEAFDEVVVATVGPVAAKLIASLPDTLVSRAQREYIESTEYVPGISLTFLVEQGHIPSNSHITPVGPEYHEAVGMISVPKLVTRGGAVLERDLAFVYPGREETHRLLDASPDEQYEFGASAARALWRDFPKDAEPYHVARYPVALPIAAPGRYAQAVRFLAEMHAPLTFAGDYFASPSAEGALRSGTLAARMLIAAREPGMARLR